MLELTVKTLDSQNHSYSVPDDITVRQFKEKISTSVGVPADKQRLIYCGRVLQDSKKLNEYDVNGKVIHLVQRPPPQAAQPSASNSATSTQSSSTANTTTVSGQFGNLPRDGNSFLLGAFTIPSDVTEPNHVQQIVQRIVSGMGELGRNATVMSRTSDDGSSVDVHINLGQVPTQQEGRQMYKQGMHMYNMANQSLKRLENFMKNKQSNEATVSSMEDGASSSAEEVVAAAAAMTTTATSSSASNDAEATMQEAETSPPHSGPSKDSTEEPLEAETTVSDKPASPQPCSSSSPDTEVTSTEGGEGESGVTNQAHPEARDRDAESRFARRVQRARPCRTQLLASLLQDLNRLHIQLQPHLERYQQYLSLSDRQLTGRELEIAQQTYNSVSEIMHYLSHAYHAVSELVVNFVQMPERNLLAYPPNIQTPAAVSIQAQINVSTSSSPNNTQPPSPDHTTAATASATAPSTTASSTTSNAEWSSDAPENPMLQIEVTPANLIDSLSASMMAPDTSAPSAREAGQTGIYVPAPPDFLQNLLQRLGNASAQRATMIVVDANGQTQARGNTATNTTTSTQTRSTARPVQRIPMVLPGFGLSSFDRFLPCSSRHVISRQPLSSTARDNSASTTESAHNQQGAQGANIPADAQLTGVITNLMSALLSQSGTSSTTAAPRTSENVQSSDRTTSENQAQARQSPAQAVPVNALLDTLIRSASTMVTSRPAARTTTQQVASNVPASGQSASGTAPSSGEPDVVNSFLQIFNTLPLEDLLGALYGRPEPLNRIQPVLRRFVQQVLLQNREPTEENIRSAVEEIVEMWRDFLVAISQEANVRENIDFVATMNNLIRSRLYDFIRLILTDTDSFGLSIHSLWGTVMHEVIALNLTCFEDGQQSLERIAQTFVRAISQYTNNQLAGMLAQLCTMNIRSMVAFVALNEGQVQHYIVRTDPATQSAPSISQPVEETGTDVISSTPDIITIVHEPMEMDTVVEPLAAESENKPLVGTSSTTGNGPEECNASSAIWRDVPVDWVPIITKDVQRQRRQAAQPPFSDAYAEGMPSKRRKMMTSQKVPTGEAARSSIEGILRRSIIAAGVQPFTSMEDVSRTLSENRTLQDAYTDQLGEVMRRRLQSDRDYHPHKFPNTEKFFFSECDDGKK